MVDIPSADLPTASQTVRSGTTDADAAGIVMPPGHRANTADRFDALNATPGAGRANELPGVAGYDGPAVPDLGGAMTYDGPIDMDRVNPRQAGEAAGPQQPPPGPVNPPKYGA